MRLGDVIAERFEIEHAAASGGMGQVFRALDRRSGAPVAVKVLHQTGALEIERFARETEVLATLHHPGIVEYISGGVMPSGDPYLVMEWLEGEPLSEYLTRTQLTPGESLALGLRVARALSAIHGRSIVHRDLKPSNLFLRGGSIEEVTLIDFGIASRPDAGRALTVPGAILGTPGYIAPEQAHGEPDVDARADVFSLGCVLFRCLSGRAPFAGNDALSILLKIAVDQPPKLRDLRPSIPEELESLVTRMLAKARDDRPRDGGAVAAELRAIEESIPLASGVRSSPRDVPPELTGGERRVMSLVLARRRDASGDATLAAGPAGQSGGRDLAVRAIADRHRGKLEILADGALLVLLESADAATDLATRAARCALALRAHLDGGAMVVVSGREIVGPRLPMGDLIDRAVMLLGAAPGNGQRAPILVDDVTAGLIGARFDVDVDLDETRPVAYLRGEHREPDGQRPLLGRPTACVGRERELVQLEAIFDHCADERLASAVLVTAPAGIGKSRLVHEFLRKVRAREEPAEIWFAQADSMSAGSAFSLLGQALRRAAGLLDGEPIEARRDKLRARVRKHFKGQAPQHVAEFLGELVGTSFAGVGDAGFEAARQDPVLRGEQMRRAWLTFLRAECAAHPVLIVLEDLQWGDVPTVKLVDAALAELREQPLMVLALGRPDVHALFPRLWAGRYMQEIRLRELSRRASERLVRQVLGDEVGDDTVQRLVGRADGHAFYLEELIRAAAQGRGAELPETVLAMVQARLERLDPETRRVLRACSLFGETFWAGGVDTLVGHTGVSSWLTALAEQELIALKEQARFPEEVEYRFRHSLVREAAYGMLTEDDRSLGHRLAGAWLEQAGETDAMVLAEHFERGGAADRAVAWFQRAMEHALEGGDLDAVVERAERGLRCGATGVTRGVLLAMQGYVHVWRTSYAAAAACYRDALPELPPGGSHWYLSVGGGLYASASTGDFARVAELITLLRAELLEEGAPLPPVQGMSAAVPILCIAGHHEIARAFIQRFAALDAPTPAEAERPPERSGIAGLDVARCHYAFFAEGDPWSLHAHAAAALAHGERTGELRVIDMAQAYTGAALVRLGDFARGEPRLREAREAATAHGLHLVAQFTETFLVDALLSRGALDEAEPIIIECVADTRQSALTASACAIAAAQLARLRGDLAGASTLVLDAIRICEPLSPGYSADAFAILAALELARGDQAAARAAAGRSLGHLAAAGSWCNETAVRVACAEVLDAAGDPGAARQAIAAARGRIEALAASIDDPAHRDGFLHRVPENARALALAERWAGG